MARVDLKGLLPEELAELLQSLGEPAYRAGQIFRWLHHAGVSDFSAMTDLSQELRARLAAASRITELAVRAHEISRADGTHKFLFGLADGAAVETVVIPHPTRTTVCVSTQVGCAFGCLFCASGAEGFVRNLTAAEIVDQVIQAGRHTRQRLSNAVFMGMGEPLANYDNTRQAVRLLHEPAGLGLSYRRISISTCGLPAAIRKLADEGPAVHLALSLHAPDDELRNRLMPVNRQHPMAELLAAGHYYVRQTGRKMSLEYALLAEVNDSPAQARKLAGLARGWRCMVNLIPLNPTPAEVAASPSPRVSEFVRTLRELGVEVAVRRSYGADIRAACGQLRAGVGDK